MAINLNNFGLAMNTAQAVPTSPSFRPPSWPPPKDWVCIEDKDGNAVSRYGDHIWNFHPWTGKAKSFNFGDGPKSKANTPVIDPDNAERLRQLVTWRIWGQRGVKTVNTLLAIAMALRQIIALCSANNILASDLSRYPALIDKVAQTLAPSTYKRIIGELEGLRDARDFLGFELLDAAGIQRLKAAQPDHMSEQTEFIPPRIWSYVVNRVAECISEYLAHQEQIEACFTYCVMAYKQNGVMEYRKRSRSRNRNPFQGAPSGHAGVLSGITYHGPFADAAQRFGVKDVIERWAGTIKANSGIKIFSTYLHLINYAALIDITSFTLMRIDEARSVRWNCLLWHGDSVYGRIPLIQSETTKTDPDDSALWVTSPSVEPAILALQSIAKMRLSYAGRWSHSGNPALITYALEPWGSCKQLAEKRGLKPTVFDLGTVLRHFPLLFDLHQLTITEDDYRIAKTVCPSLNSEKFQVGKPWFLAWHQFRRTGAVNMFASGEISDSSMQFQMKHLTPLMSLYYGRGNSTLHLNDSARALLVNAQYEEMGRQLAEVHTDRYISPYGDARKAELLAPANGGNPVNLIKEVDVKKYEEAAHKHIINFRLTPLGACMNNDKCDGDCVSAVGDCAGGNDNDPCIHVLFDRKRAEANQKRLNGVLDRLKTAPPDSPLYRHLQQERRGLENYFAHINRT